MANHQLDYLLAEALKHPRLTAEEERELAHSYQTGVRAQRLIGRTTSTKRSAFLREQINRGNEARERLLLSNILLVIHVASHYLRRFGTVANDRVELGDACQDGAIGFLRALEDYDPAIGRLSTYAVWWIVQAVQRGIDNTSQTIRIPVHKSDERRRVKKARRRLDLRKGSSEVGLEEVSRETGLSPKVIAAIDRLPWTFSLDELFPTGDGEMERAEFLSDGTVLEEDLFLQITLEDLLPLARRVLSPLQFEIIQLRYFQDFTLEETGERLGFTRQRAHQYQKEALLKLRKALER